ncbi:hypothetical protein BASA60_001730 [Batrachochytrium salamandrivorans]|nr:hypothetical protein BASA60_001730 [Batrachochytrium salamandrivorans]
MSDIGCLVKYQEQAIVNYTLISDSSTFFLESVSTGEQSHDAKWIAQDMGRVIDSLAGKDFTQGTGKQKESRQKIHDIITDEQAQQMGKKEEMYLQYTNFVIKANHNKDRKDFLLSDVGKGNQDNPAVLVG